MHKKKGFTLIEVTIALLISCILVGFLMGILRLMQRGIRTATPLIDTTEQLAILYHQLTSDIQGMCVPLSAQQAQSSRKAIDKICWSISDKQNLHYLTFISNNPLEFHSDQNSGSPYLVRITYYMKKENNGMYSLYRGQSSNLEWSEQYATTQGYKICENIQSILINFYASYYKNKNDEKKSLYQASLWQYDEWIKKNTSLNLAKIPQWVHLSITLHDNLEPFIIDIEVPVYEILLHPEQKKPVTPDKPSDLSKAVQQLKQMQVKAAV